METGFKIKTSRFEGPLDLLLSLIEKKKLHVSEVSMAEVADEYVDYLKENGALPMGEIANFVLTAATILLIKSSNLLPKLDVLPEEQTDIEELEKRLAVYQRIRQAGFDLKKIFGVNKIFWPDRKAKISFAPYKLDAPCLSKALSDLIANLPKEEPKEVTRIIPTFSLEKIVEKLTERVRITLTTSFRDFTRDKKEKLEIILSFLAMLELVKQGAISVKQERNFEDIQMKTNQYETPCYY